MNEYEYMNKFGNWPVGCGVLYEMLVCMKDSITLISSVLSR